MSAPRVIQPLTAEEQAAFDLVELVIRRDMPVPLHLQIVKGYAQVIFGDPKILFTAGKTMAEGFEHARAMWWSQSRPPARRTARAESGIDTEREPWTCATCGCRSIYYTAGAVEPKCMRCRNG